MKNLSAIKKAISTLKPSSRYSIPVLDCVLIQDNTLAITDLHHSIIFKNIGIENDFCIDKKDFINAAGFIPEFKTELKPGGVIISGNGDKFQYSTNPIGDFPVIPFKNFEVIGLITDMDQARIQTALKFISADDLRPAMTCIALKDGHIFGTDAHSMFFEVSDFKNDKDFLIEKKTAVLMAMFKTEFTLSKNDKYLKFENSDVIITQMIVNGKFPDCLQVIPINNKVTMSTNKKLLIETIKKALTVANLTTHLIKFHINGSLNISSDDIDFMREYSKNIPAESNTESFEIGFNGKMMLNLLAQVEGENLTFAMSEPKRAAIINGNLLQMPVMIN